MAATSLTAYSEFGLIVAAGVLPAYLVPLALTVSLSFVLAAPANRAAQGLFTWLEPRLARFETTKMHIDEQPKDLGRARILILGMGRTGTAAYDHLRADIVAIDADTYKVAGHQAAGRNVLFADVEDAGFWRGLDISGLRAVILAMDSSDAKEAAAIALRHRGFGGAIIAHALFDDEIAQLTDAGATHTYLTMTQAGVGLADHAAAAIDLPLAARD